jgi:hypothetical protein
MMDQEYLDQCKKDKFTNPAGTCVVCGEPGLHKECEDKYVHNREVMELWDKAEKLIEIDQPIETDQDFINYFRNDYLNLCEKNEFINPEGECIVCGKPGLHKECEDKHVRDGIERFKQHGLMQIERKKIENELLRRHSLSGSYGPVDKEQYRIVKAKTRDFIGSGHSYKEETVIESKEWWFLPFFYIGNFGYLVEKSSGDVYGLGSGLGSWNREELGINGSHWNAILCYLHWRDTPGNEGIEISKKDSKGFFNDRTVQFVPIQKSQRR